MTEKRDIDWVAIEAAYRAGELSNRQIAKRHGVSESAIRKQAKAKGWVRTERPVTRQLPASLAMPERRPVEGEVLDPKDHPARVRELAARMLDELDAVTAHIGEIEEAIIAETADDQTSRRRNAMLNAVSLGSRASTLKTIVQALGGLKEAEAAGGKKAQQQERAKEVAASGRFAPMQLVVNNR